MAFQQPQRQQPRPRSFSSTAPPPPPAVTAPAPPRRSPRQEQQEWILFSPAPHSDTYGHTDSTVRSEHHGGQLSDFGSLDTAAAPNKGKGRDNWSSPRDYGPARNTSAIEDDVDDEDNRTDDLDSLDDGLHAFNEPSITSSQRRNLDRNGDTVLPTHDGLGLFPGVNTQLQEQLWQHERYNPRRKRNSLRRSSLHKKFEALEDVPDKSDEQEKVERIEKWRVEQSRAILEEIEKETRRRRRRKSRASASRTQRTSSNHSSEPTSTHREAQASTPAPLQSSERMSFWERLTRSVIRNLMGIDDATLEFIFGESLPAEPPAEKVSPASELIDHAERTIRDDGPLATESWEDRLLIRIAKELGILLGHITEHPGAFTTFLRAQEPAPYAGIQSSASDPLPLELDPYVAQSSLNPSNTSPHFTPTLAHQGHAHRHSVNTADASLWGIEEEDEDRISGNPENVQASIDAATRLQQEREYWERDLDVKMVFGFLRDRFASPNPPSSPAISQPRMQPTTSKSTPLTTTTTNPSSSSNVNSLRRSALIRHHHPLVSRNVAASTSQQNAQSRTRLNSSAGTPLSPILGRRPSCAADTESCASQSTKRSKTAHSGSSRNFWDIGGSAGQGGSVGAWSVGWGEV